MNHAKQPSTIQAQAASKSWLVILATVSAIIALFLFQDLIIAATSKGLKDISEGMSEQVKAVAELLVIVAYVAGVGFALAGVVQFKAHKDNPAQVPLSKPIVYLVVGACLLFLPTIIKTAGQTIFGGGQESGGQFSGVIE